MRSSTSNSDLAAAQAAPAPPCASSRRRASEGVCALAGVATFVALAAIGLAAKQLPPLNRHEPIVVGAGQPPDPHSYLAYSRGGVDEYLLYHNLGGVIGPARRADVLFLGNSRALHALPQATLRPFFGRLGMSYYVLAMEYGESNVLPEAMIRKYDLRPKWVIVNADPFFTDQPSDFGARVMAEAPFDAWKFRFETNAAFEVRRRLHRFVPHVDLMAGERDWILYRSYDDGTAWCAAYSGPSQGELGGWFKWSRPVLLSVARRFKNEVEGRGGRLALTCVPPAPDHLARFLARELHVPLILMPADEARSLQTMDGDHLFHDSAVRFSSELLAQFEGVLPRPTTRPAAHPAAHPDHQPAR